MSPAGVSPAGVWAIDSNRHTGKVALRRPLFDMARLVIAVRGEMRSIEPRDVTQPRTEAEIGET